MNYRSHRNTSPKKGFSLIELLVVISIMGIILAMGAVSFSGAQRRGRDAKRRSDMNSIQKGFEQYFLENSNQYTSCGTMGSQTEQFPAGLPDDPIDDTTYRYTQTSCDADSYCSCARLELDNTGNSGANCAFSSATKNYFCVSNLQ